MKFNLFENLIEKIQKGESENIKQQIDKNESILKIIKIIFIPLILSLVILRSYYFMIIVIAVFMYFCIFGRMNKKVKLFIDKMHEVCLAVIRFEDFIKIEMKLLRNCTDNTVKNKLMDFYKDLIDSFLMNLNMEGNNHYDIFQIIKNEIFKSIFEKSKCIFKEKIQFSDILVLNYKLSNLLCMISEILNSLTKKMNYFQTRSLPDDQLDFKRLSKGFNINTQTSEIINFICNEYSDKILNKSHKFFNLKQNEEIFEALNEMIYDFEHISNVLKQVRNNMINNISNEDKANKSLNNEKQNNSNNNSNGVFNINIMDLKNGNPNNTNEIISKQVNVSLFEIMKREKEIAHTKDMLLSDLDDFLNSNSQRLDNILQED